MQTFRFPILDGTDTMSIDVFEEDVGADDNIGENKAVSLTGLA